MELKDTAEYEVATKCVSPEELTLDEYQSHAMATCTTTSDNLPYMLFGLQEEVGELSGKIAKLIRKGKVKISTDGNLTRTIFDDVSPDEITAIKAECGDVAWMLAGICKVLGFSLNDVARHNLDKLADRAKRNVIIGNGDNR